MISKLSGQWVIKRTPHFLLPEYGAYSVLCSRLQTTTLFLAIRLVPSLETPESDRGKCDLCGISEGW